MHPGKSETEKNALNVRLELQADFYAGMWAHIEEQKDSWIQAILKALNTLHAMGDDTLQEQTIVIPSLDGFTTGRQTTHALVQTRLPIRRP